MNFSNVKDWTIYEGSVIRVTDSLNRVIWEKGSPQPTPETTYFYIEDASGAANTLSIKKNMGINAPSITVYTSTDQTNWTLMGTTSTTAITATVPANGRLYLKATANTWCSWDGSYNCYNSILCGDSFNVGGNIMSLLYGDNFINQTVLQDNRNFYRLFDGNSYTLNKIVNASELVLPATILTNFCYHMMFYECRSLATAPTITATTMAYRCCEAMFEGCRALTTAPALPATTLAQECYRGMFKNCTSLTAAPALPATLLYESCYRGMFYGCTGLTAAPALPATTLADYSYQAMFYNCTNLGYVVIYAQDISATDCIGNWLSGVSATGDFYNYGGATYPSGSSGIPSGWTVHAS